MLRRLVAFAAWLVGPALIFFGLLGLTDSVAGGLLTIASGLLIAPPSYRRLKKRLPVGPVTRVVVAGASLALGAPLMVNNGVPAPLAKNAFTPHTERSEDSPPLEKTLEDADLALVDAIAALTSRKYDDASGGAMRIINALSGPLARARSAEDEAAIANLLARHAHALLVYRTAQLLERKDAVFSVIEQTEIADLIPQLELLERGYSENARDWRDTAELFENMQVENLSPETMNDFRLVASTQQGFSDDIHARVVEFRSLVPGYVPIERKVIPKRRDVAAEDEIVSPQLRSFFEGFDGDRDGKVSMKEAQDFFYWVEDNITYRYDDEEEADPFVGTLVGDDRPGPDARQTPAETYRERAGDCEDMSTLEQAFYASFGVEAYVVGVNAEEASGVDHAAAVVRIADHVQEFKDFLGDVFYYEVGSSARDVFGDPVAPGAYLVVDNSYSAAFGYISGGVMEGRYEVHCAIPLARGYGDEWEIVKRRCGVEMN